MQSSTSWVCSAAWMWIGPLCDRIQDDAQRVRRHGAQRMRRDADAGIGKRRDNLMRARDEAQEHRSGSLMKRRCPGVGASVAKTAIGVEATAAA